jgi:hypothetical protein
VLVARRRVTGAADRSLATTHRCTVRCRRIRALQRRCNGSELSIRCASPVDAPSRTSPSVRPDGRGTFKTT